MHAEIDSRTVVKITFKSRDEIADLLKELQTWQPTHGWSTRAQTLFDILTDAARGRNGYSGDLQEDDD